MLKGEKISLRPFEVSDAANINLLRQDFEAIKQLVASPFPGNEISQKEWIGRMYPNGIVKNIYLAIEENESGMFIGYIAARNIEYIHSHAEIGEILTSQSRGKGYFKEIIALMLEYLFNQLNLNKVSTTILSDNEVSVAAHKKYGFIEEGYLKKHVYQDGTYKDLIILSIFKEDYFKNNKNK